MSLVYFVQAGDPDGLVKIGTTQNLEIRLGALQTSCPEVLHLLSCFSGGRSTERSLHRRFAQYRTNGEWFSAARELLRYAYLSSVGLADPPSHGCGLAEWLAQTGMRQKDFSDLTTIATALLSRYVNGDQRPSERHIKIISSATDGVVTADSWPGAPPKKGLSNPHPVQRYMDHNRLSLAEFLTRLYLKTGRKAQEKAFRHVLNGVHPAGRTLMVDLNAVTGISFDELVAWRRTDPVRGRNNQAQGEA